MSSDGEITKNQQSEVFEEADEKPNLDTTDSSQDSVGVKSEADEDKDKKVEEVKEKEPPAEAVKAEEKPTNDSAKQNDTDKKDKNDVEAKNSKEEKNEDKTDDDTEGGENSGDEDEEDEDDDKKDVPLLDQPLEKSGPRERKKVQRFSEDLPLDAKESTKVDIPSGSGVQLGDIPRIDASISRFKTDDLKLLHKVLFKTPGKTVIIKKNIKKFNGFDFKKDSDAYSKKVSSVAKMEIKQLKSICEMLDLEKNGKKEEISERICEFLLEPKDSGKPVGGGRPRRSAAVRANNRGYSSHDDEDDSDEGSKRASRSRRGKGKRVNLKEESSSESDAEFNPSEESDEERPRVKSKQRSKRGAPKKQESEDEASDVEETPPSSDESEEPKTKRKRGPVAKVQNSKNKKTPAKNAKATPKKTPAANKKKVETKKPTSRKRGKEESEDEEDEKDNSENNEESSSGDDEPLVKKSKSPQPPTDEEIKTYVKEILEGANLEEITMKTVCKQVYAHYPDFDLAHKKDFIKTTVKSLIST